MLKPITAQEVKDLRGASGASVQECKHALRDANGNFELALRELLDRPDDEEPVPEDA